MQTFDFINYITTDLTHRRTLSEVSVGLLTIIVLTFSLLIVLVLSVGLMDFIQKSFFYLKPEIGIIQITKEVGFTPEDIKRLEEYAEENHQTSKTVSWIATDVFDTDKVDFAWQHINNKFYNDDEDFLYLFSVRADDPMLDETFGVSYLFGHSFNHSSQELEFGVILTKHIFSESVIDEVVYEEQAHENIQQEAYHFYKENPDKIPKYFIIDFVDPIKADGAKYTLGPSCIPITGFIDTDSSAYPAIFISQDVAYAYQNNNQQDNFSWHASFPLQFVDSQGNHLFPYKITPPKLGASKPFQVKKIKDWKLAKACNLSNTHKEIQTIHDADFYDLSQQKSLRKGLRYQEVLVWMSPEAYNSMDFQTTRNKLRTEIQTQFKERDFVVKNLESEKTDMISTLSNLKITILFFATSAMLILFLLSFLCVYFISKESILRKRQDIGLLKACGMTEVEIILIYISEMLLVSLISIFVGIIIVSLLIQLLSPSLTEYFKEALGVIVKNDISITFTVTQEAAFYTLLTISFASLLGSLLPAKKAAYAKPIDQLSTHL